MQSHPSLESLVFFYVPSKLIVHGDAAATALNVAASETLFRLGIAGNLIGQTLFIFVALALYDLLKPVNQRHAIAMLTLILVAIPIAFLNELNAIAALLLVRGADFLSLVDKPQRDALAMLFLRLHGHGFDIAGIFWGLWLFPLGLLVYRSGFLPRLCPRRRQSGARGHEPRPLPLPRREQPGALVDRLPGPLRLVPRRQPRSGRR